MSDEKRADQQVGKKVKRKRPNWRLHQKSRFNYLHDAVALSMNTRPSHMDQIIVQDPKAKRVYQTRIGQARREMHSSGGMITVIEKGNEKDGSDWLIDLASFVKFADKNWIGLREEFRQLGESSPAADSHDAGKPAKRRGTDTFVAALIRLLVEIAKRAAEAKETFDVENLPGQRKDLLELARKFDAKLDYELTTFQTYIKGKCKCGRGHTRTDFYKNLFPEYFK